MLSLDKRDDFLSKNEEFYNCIINKLLVTITGMSHHFFAVFIEARDFYPESKNDFYKKYSNVT